MQGRVTKTILSSAFQHHVFIDTAGITLPCGVSVPCVAFPENSSTFLCVHFQSAVYKKTVMLDDKCKLKIHFLVITDLPGLTVSSSERLVCTCEDHPKSQTNSSLLEIGFFPPKLCFKKWGEISLM